jgi:hypothetical protein
VGAVGAEQVWGLRVGIGKLLGGAAVAIAASSVLSVSANATIMTATYTGTVTSGFDITGLFGVAGANLAGERFTVVYTYDTAKAGSSHFQDASEELIYGGTQYGPPNPGIDAKVTIGSGTVDVLAGFSSYFITSQGAPAYTEHKIVQTSTGAFPGASSHISVDTTLFTGSVPNRLADPFSGTPSGPFAAFSSGVFQDIVYDPQTGYAAEAKANLTVDHLTVAAAGVPEPATWALMLIGFGGLGATLRRRSASTRPALG